MKLTALFARYLYLYKELRLPGIGVFKLDPSFTAADYTDRNHKEFLAQITYLQEPVAAPDHEFIDFIRTETGKIRPLAESDLDSFLSDGKILLNIGKPFILEGIGTLLKNSSGNYDFIPGNPLRDRIDTNQPERKVTEKPERSVYMGSEQSSGTRKVVVPAAIVIGIILVVWGGYSLYNRNAPTEANETGTSITHQPVVLDSASGITASADLDSSQVRPAPVSENASRQFRFIIERTSNKRRALHRYNQLLDHRASIQLATPDSVNFSLYFDISALASDTARIRDSLKTWYGRNRVYVEPVDHLR